MMQVYSLGNQFLPKEWIMEKWEEGYYITGMAGSMTGNSLVVMSKGTPYTQQSYKVSDSFPFKVRTMHVLHYYLRCLWSRHDGRRAGTRLMTNDLKQVGGDK